VTFQLQDIGLRESVTPRAHDIRARVTKALEAMPRLDVDREMEERRSRLKEWQFVMNLVMASQRDLQADEHAAWLELLGG